MITRRKKHVVSAKDTCFVLFRIFITFAREFVCEIWRKEMKECERERQSEKEVRRAGDSGIDRR